MRSVARPGGQRLGVELRRSERCPEPVGEIRRRLPLFLEEVLYLFGQLVELFPNCLDLRRSGGRDPSREIPVLQPRRRLGEFVDWSHNRAPESIRSEHREADQDHAETCQDQPRPPHAACEFVVRSDHADDGDRSVRLGHRNVHGLALRNRSPEGRPGEGGVQVFVWWNGKPDDCSVGKHDRRAEFDESWLANRRRNTFVGRRRSNDRDEAGDALGIALGTGHGTIERKGAHEDPERDEERDHHHRGDPGSDEDEAPPHESGSIRRTPTPRRVWMYFGSAAVSPSFLRSHDKCTSTVLSAPPYG